MTSDRRILSPATVRGARRLQAWWPAAAIALAFTLGWFVSGWWASGFGTANLRLGDQFGGTVTQVTEDGAGFCLRQDPGGQQRCSSAYQLVGSEPLQVGQHVEVAAAIIWPKGSNVGTEVYIVTVPAPQPSPASEGPAAQR